MKKKKEAIIWMFPKSQLFGSIQLIENFSLVFCRPAVIQPQGFRPLLLLNILPEALHLHSTKCTLVLKGQTLNLCFITFSRIMCNFVATECLWSIVSAKNVLEKASTHKCKNFNLLTLKVIFYMFIFKSSYILGYIDVIFGSPCLIINRI